VNPARALLTSADRRQRTTRFVAPIYAVIKKFGDDEGNQFVVGLGWYGFVAIYPLLLVVITVLGFVGAASLGHRIVSTIHQFPVVGSDFNPAHGSHNLHGSILGLVVGLVGSTYGAQGVTRTAQHAMARVWNVSRRDLPGFFHRLARSLVGLSVIGSAFVMNAAIASFATGAGESYVVRLAVLVAMLLVNVGFYLGAFRALTPSIIAIRVLLPGAIVGSFGFTLLITLGSGLIQHQVRYSSATYGQFGVVIGLVGFLFLLGKISLYGAELNSVLAGHLWPRGILADDPTDVDDQVLQSGPRPRAASEVRPL
jgi:uncharacterized BrkB/YihY/UPF0761 family membrane protein